MVSLIYFQKSFYCAVMIASRNDLILIASRNDPILMEMLISSGSYFLVIVSLYQTRMRVPSLLTQCLPGLVPQDRGSQSMSTVSERDVHLPSPAVEILPSKTAHPYKYTGDNLDLQGLNVFKGRVSVADIIGFTGFELISSKPDATSNFISKFRIVLDVIRYLALLGCGSGLPGIFACLKGAFKVHFQDLNAETIRCTTIPNVLANLEQARDRQSRQPESPLTPSRQIIAPTVHFYAGDWEEFSSVLSVVRDDVSEVTTEMSVSFSEEDFMDGCSSQDGSILEQEISSRRSRKLSGSRAWERASETDQGEGGYDVILMTKIAYSASSLKKLYALIKKCLRPPYGVVYLATKKNYVGFDNTVRHLRTLVDEEGIFGAHLIKEVADRDIWKFFPK
ncbi:hypothetical protein DITRI_Ditri17bG0025500 [Diplodiscus trichospermus]